MKRNDLSTSQLPRKKWSQNKKGKIAKKNIFFAAAERDVFFSSVAQNRKENATCHFNLRKSFSTFASFFAASFFRETE